MNSRESWCEKGGQIGPLRSPTQASRDTLVQGWKGQGWGRGTSYHKEGKCSSGRRSRHDLRTREQDSSSLAVREEGRTTYAKVFCQQGITSKYLAQREKGGSPLLKVETKSWRNKGSTQFLSCKCSFLGLMCIITSGSLELEKTQVNLCSKELN